VPNGYGTTQIYFPAGEGDLLHFVQELPNRSAWIRDAIRLKRALDGEETVIVAIIRRVIREELAAVLSAMPKNAAPNFGRNFESSQDPDEGDEADLADFVGRNTF